MPLADSVLVTEVVLEGTRDAVAAPETLTEGVPLSQKLPDSVTLGEEVGEALRHSVTEPDTEGVRLAVTLGEAVSVVEMVGEALTEADRHRVGLLLSVLLVLRVRVPEPLLQTVTVGEAVRHSVTETVPLGEVLWLLLGGVLPEAVAQPVADRVSLSVAGGEVLPLGLPLGLPEPEGEAEGLPVSPPTAPLALLHRVAVREPVALAVTEKGCVVAIAHTVGLMVEVKVARDREALGEALGESVAEREALGEREAEGEGVPVAERLTEGLGEAERHRVGDTLGEEEREVE